MRAQVLAPGTVSGYQPLSPQPFGWRSRRSVRGWKLFGLATTVVIPAILNVVVGLF